MHKVSKVLFALCLGGTANLAAAADIYVDGQAIIGSDIESISISPSTGDIFVVTFPGYTVTKNDAPPPDPDQVAIDSFTTSSSAILVGETVDLSWTTTNAVSCETADGTQGWRAHTPDLPSGNKTIWFGTVGNYTFTLTCFGAEAGDSDVRTVIVNVSEEQEPPPVPDGCNVPPLLGNEQTWTAFWGEQFPGPTYDNVNLDVPRFGYHALVFNTGNVVDNGSIATLETTLTAGARTGSISECPGDFDVAPECTKTWGIGGAIMWATDGKAGACQLENNKTYYLNLTYTDGFDSGDSNCAGAPCRMKVQHANF